MEGYLYILKTRGDHYYIGSTNNLERRIFEHNRGKTASLKKLLPIELVFSKKYDSLKNARKVEIKIKRFKNRNIIDRIVQEQKIIAS